PPRRSPLVPYTTLFRSFLLSLSPADLASASAMRATPDGFGGDGGRERTAHTGRSCMEGSARGPECRLFFFGTDRVEIAPDVVLVTRRYLLLLEHLFHGALILVIHFFVAATGEPLLAGFLDGLGLARALAFLALHLGVLTLAAHVGGATTLGIAPRAAALVVAFLAT